MSQDISPEQLKMFEAWTEANKENGITTWTAVEGTPEEKVEAMFKSTAFWVDYGYNAPVWHSVKVKGDSFSYVDPEDTVEDEETELEVPSGDRITMSRQESVDQLIEFKNPEVQVSYKEGV